VRQLARAQDGEVYATERPGGGTIMRLHLRRPDIPGAPATGKAPVTQPAATQPAATEPAATSVG